MEIGDKVEFREGEGVILAASPDDDGHVLIVDRGEKSRSRYVVCLYRGGKSWISPYFTSCILSAAAEYTVLTTRNDGRVIDWRKD